MPASFSFALAHSVALAWANCGAVANCFASLTGNTASPKSWRMSCGNVMATVQRLPFSGRFAPTGKFIIILLPICMVMRHMIARVLAKMPEIIAADRAY